MSDLYDRIASLCQEKGITGYRLCKETEISPSTLTDLKMGRKEGLSAKSADKIASFFGVSVGYLLGTTPSEPSSTDKGVWIPVLGRVQAGIPVEAVEEVLDYEEIPHALAATGEYFALSVRGDSMEPRICAGDVVIVRKQADCDSGDLVVVLVNGSEATIKRIKKVPDGIVLVPNNPAYEAMFYSKADIAGLPVSILGKVVELRGKI